MSRQRGCCSSLLRGASMRGVWFATAVAGCGAVAGEAAHADAAPGSASPNKEALGGPASSLPSTPFARAWAALQHRIEVEQQRRARVPVPVGFHFKPKKIGSLDLRPELAGVAVADLDHDGRMEAFVATEHAVAVLDFSRGPRVVATVRLPDVAQRRSRQLVGSVYADGAEIRAQVSAHPSVLAVVWNGSAYTGAVRVAPAVPGGAAGFEFCKDQTWPLHPGRNWFDTGVVGQGVYTLVCRDDLADAQGNLWSLRASVSEHDVLHVDARPHCDGNCGATQPTEIVGAGYALAVDDLDQNGVPEVLSSAALANADIVTITELSTPPRVVLRRRFTAGVVALLTGDFDGDGKRDALALVRAGKRVDVWRLQ